MLRGTTSHGVRRAALTLALLVGLGVGTLPATSVATAADGVRVAGARPAPELYLVTLDGPGTSGYRGPLPTPVTALSLRREQDLALAAVAAPEPVYRWTTALNGFAVRLRPTQAAELARTPTVALVERQERRRLAAAPTAGRGLTGRGLTGLGQARGGAGTVIGVVDSGIWPESPLFSNVPGLGRRPRDFRGACAAGADWPAGSCNGKLVGARWFVDGFGATRVRSSSSLSARDDEGHGTQVASIAAGNARVSVQVNDQRLGSYGGVAPQARVAAYKACWTAPDPADDGCSTADLVSAVDAAVRDRVDVLNLSVGGPATFDTVERALLGAGEAGIVVVGAAGNGGARSFAAHPGPWVTTVGGTTGPLRRGRVRLGDGTGLDGAMASTAGTASARVVAGGDVAAPDSSRSAARVCTPGSLDAARVAGAIVLCERGSIGRVDKSAAVDRADGAGMILANTVPGPTDADFHSVPTVHLNRTAALTLRRWLAEHPRGRASLRPLGVGRGPVRAAVFTPSGDPTAGVLKPDLVGPAVGVLGAVPPSVRSTRWDFASGTSVAAARTSGAAAVLLSRHGWPADVVRSALATTAGRVPDVAALRVGAGRLRTGRAATPGLAYRIDPTAYRAWLTGTRDDLNTPSLLLADGRTRAGRTVTNVGRRTMYFSSRATGFERHRVQVAPAAVRLAPGERARFTVTVSGSPQAGPLDDGAVTWRAANGTRTRIPVLISR